MVGSGISPLLQRIFSVESPLANLLNQISFGGSSQSDLLRWIFLIRSPPMDLLSWIFSDKSSQSNLLRRIFSVGSSPTDLLRKPLSSPTILNSITSTPSWNTSGVALSSASDRIKYTFITSLMHITYML